VPCFGKAEKPWDPCWESRRFILFQKDALYRCKRDGPAKGERSEGSVSGSLREVKLQHHFPRAGLPAREMKINREESH